MAKKHMGPCPATTKRGYPCPNNGHRQDGYLCHIHREMPEQRIAAYLALSDKSDSYWRQMVQCEARTQDGEQCRITIRRIFGVTLNGIRCARHGGGRNGMGLTQALTAARMS